MSERSIRTKILAATSLVATLPALAVFSGGQMATAAAADPPGAATVVEAAQVGHGGPPRLRPAAGFASYDGCNQHCARSVPASLWRPLHIPTTTGCPTSTLHRIPDQAVGKMAGPGPVFPGALGLRSTRLYPAETGAKDPWKRFKVLWVGSPRYRGPVLIRGRQLHGNLRIGFGDAPTPVSSLQFPAGDENEMSTAADGISAGNWRQWPSSLRAAAPGCYGIQIDGLRFSVVVVVRLVE
jgi:hypothetical protein